MYNLLTKSNEMSSFIYRRWLFQIGREKEKHGGEEFTSCHVMLQLEPAYGVGDAGESLWRPPEMQASRG